MHLHRGPHDSRPIVLLVFANERPDEHGYLRMLNQEESKIREALARPVHRDLIHIVRETSVTHRELFDLLDTHQSQIVGVHFAGHADDEGVLLEDDNRKPVVARMDGIAARLSRLERLEWVFLNACATASHVAVLHAHLAVPVIATSSAVQDSIAADFAYRFYRGLGEGRTYIEAFSSAEEAARTAHAMPDELTRMSHGHDTYFEELRDAERWRFLRPSQLDQPERWPWLMALADGQERLGERGLAEHVLALPPVPQSARRQRGLVVASLLLSAMVAGAGYWAFSPRTTDEELGRLAADASELDMERSAVVERDAHPPDSRPVTDAELLADSESEVSDPDATIDVGSARSGTQDAPRPRMPSRSARRSRRAHRPPQTTRRPKLAPSPAVEQEAPPSPASKLKLQMDESWTHDN